MDSFRDLFKLNSPRKQEVADTTKTLHNVVKTSYQTHWLIANKQSSSKMKQDEIDKEITELELLIKKLQSDIAQMTKNANKPLSENHSETGSRLPHNVPNNETLAELPYDIAKSSDFSTERKVNPLHVPNKSNHDTIFIIPDNEAKSTTESIKCKTNPMKFADNSSSTDISQFNFDFNKDVEDNVLVAKTESQLIILDTAEANLKHTTASCEKIPKHRPVHSNDFPFTVIPGQNTNIKPRLCDVIDSSMKNDRYHKNKLSNTLNIALKPADLKKINHQSDSSMNVAETQSDRNIIIDSLKPTFTKKKHKSSVNVHASSRRPQRVSTSHNPNIIFVPIERDDIFRKTNRAGSSRNTDTICKNVLIDEDNVDNKISLLKPMIKPNSFANLDEVVIPGLQNINSQKNTLNDTEINVQQHLSNAQFLTTEIIKDIRTEVEKTIQNMNPTNIISDTLETNETSTYSGDSTKYVETCKNDLHLSHNYNDSAKESINSHASNNEPRISIEFLDKLDAAPAVHCNKDENFAESINSGSNSISLRLSIDSQSPKNVSEIEIDRFKTDLAITIPQNITDSKDTFSFALTNINGSIEENNNEESLVMKSLSNSLNMEDDNDSRSENLAKGLALDIIKSEIPVTPDIFSDVFEDSQDCISEKTEGSHESINTKSEI